MRINQSDQNKKVIYFFMPTIEGGGIEKNLLIFILVFITIINYSFTCKSINKKIFPVT